jgi:hypothetical protein
MGKDLYQQPSVLTTLYIIYQLDQLPELLAFMGSGWHYDQLYSIYKPTLCWALALLDQSYYL